jgi:hypothetical protein
LEEEGEKKKGNRETQASSIHTFEQLKPIEVPAGK